MKIIIIIICKNFKYLKIHVLLAALAVETATTAATATATATATHFKIQLLFVGLKTLFSFVEFSFVGSKLVVFNQ